LPRYFRGTFHSCMGMGIMPMLFTWQGLLVWTQQDTTISLDNRGVLLAGVRYTMVAPRAHLQEELCLNTLHTSSSYACKQCLYVLCPICIYNSLEITK
jgi:hypothetical protein